MLDELKAYIESFDDECDALVRLDELRIATSGESAALKLAVVNAFDADGYEARWEVSIDGLRDYRVVRPLGNLRTFAADHVLARRVWEPQRKLYCRGRPANAADIVGRLAIAEAKMLGEWLDVGSYLRHPAELEALLESGYGLLADGPESLIDQYAHVLTEAGIASSHLESQPAMGWNGIEFREIERTLGVLVLGRAYFVAVRFSERRLDAQGG